MLYFKNQKIRARLNFYTLQTAQSLVFLFSIILIMLMDLRQLLALKRIFNFATRRTSCCRGYSATSLSGFFQVWAAAATAVARFENQDLKNPQIISYGNFIQGVHKKVPILKWVFFSIRDSDVKQKPLEGFANQF